jgi:hypothetical protein
MTIAQLEREVRRLKIYAAGTTVLAVAALFAPQGNAQPKASRFTTIDVERLNIVEADGRPALVLANTQRIPGPFVGGRELPKELSAGRTGSAGLIFIDAQGNEVGGLVYGAQVKADGSYLAESGFTFDQHNQDQVVGFEYDDDGTRRTYGMSVWDRPTKVSIAEMLDAAKDAPDRQSRHRRFEELLKQRGDTSGARRVFLGSQDRTASLKLSDAAGRERVRLSVDSANTARLEFLDESGKVVYALPPR